MTQQTTKIRPAAKVKLGNIHGAIWKRVNEKGHPRYSVKFERTYKTEQGYRNASDFNAQELLSLVEVAKMALDWIRTDESIKEETSRTVQETNA